MQSHSSLYRPAAIAHQTAEKLGTVLLLPRKLHVLSSLILIAILCGGVGVLMSGSYASKVKVAGWIINPNSVIPINQYEPSGRVTQVLVKNKQWVKKGQALVKIKRTTGLINGERLTQQQTLLLNQSLITAQDTQDLALARDKRDFEQYAAEQQQLSSQKSLLTANNNDLVTQIQRYESQTNKLKTLSLSGLTSRNEADNMAMRLTDMRITQRQTALTIIDIEQASSILHQRIREIEDSAQMRNSAHQQALGATQLQLEQALSQNEYFVLAPADGQIDSLQARLGTDLSTAATLMKIIDHTNPLQAQIFIPASAIGLLKTEQTIAMRLDAFPYQQYGKIFARLHSIDSSIMLPNQLAQTPVLVQQAVFLAYAQLNSQTIDVSGKHINFKQGMTFEADVIVQRRNIFEWLLAPIYRLKGAL